MNLVGLVTLMAKKGEMVVNEIGVDRAGDAYPSVNLQAKIGEDILEVTLSVAMIDSPITMLNRGLITNTAVTVKMNKERVFYSTHLESKDATEIGRIIGKQRDKVVATAAKEVHSKFETLIGGKFIG